MDKGQGVIVSIQEDDMDVLVGVLNSETGGMGHCL